MRFSGQFLRGGLVGGADSMKEMSLSGANWCLKGPVQLFDTSMGIYVPVIIEISLKDQEG